MKTGVVLAGGTGSRLMPLTLATNKHLLPVYNKPMIYYSIETLKAIGCTNIIIVTGGEHIGHIAETVGSGSKFGLKISYHIQDEADGIAGAIRGLEGYIGGLFPVILGDNLFHRTPEIPPDMPAIYVQTVPYPDRFGVFDSKTQRIIEKPEEFISNEAVLGLYIYDDNVFDYIRQLEKSDRGEYEITDVNNMYLSAESPMCIMEYRGYWADLGTPDSLLDAAQCIATIAENDRIGI